jgi:hypothetical protein
VPIPTGQDDDLEDKRRNRQHVLFLVKRAFFISFFVFSSFWQLKKERMLIKLLLSFEK